MKVSLALTLKIVWLSFLHQQHVYKINTFKSSNEILIISQIIMYIFQSNIEHTLL